MALTSSMACVDSLSFKFSLHRLEDAYVSRPAFYYSWSEPFDLDYAGRSSDGNPKRSRSYPTTLVAPANNSSNSSRKGEHKLRSVDIFRDSDPQYRRRTDVSVNTHIPDLHSTSSASAKDRSVAGCIYANEKTDKAPVEEDEFTSDEELAELCCASQSTKDIQPKEQRFIESKHTARKENIQEKTKARKRTLDHSHDLTHESVVKRSRPRLDFEKMRLSRSEILNQSCPKKILFDETFFKPILPMEKSQ